MSCERDTTNDVFIITCNIWLHFNPRLFRLELL
jgi:hypothetical protein